MERRPPPLLQAHILSGAEAQSLTETPVGQEEQVGVGEGVERKKQERGVQGVGL